MSRRPDLILEDKKSKKIWICDMACPQHSGGNLHMSRYGDVPLFWVLFLGLLLDLWVPFCAILGFLGIIFFAIPRFLGIIFLVKFDFFWNNSDFGVLILIFASMTLWDVACRALVSMILQFSLLFYYVCAKSSMLSITPISLSSYICSAF